MTPKSGNCVRTTFLHQRQSRLSIPSLARSSKTTPSLSSMSPPVIFATVQSECIFSRLARRSKKLFHPRQENWTKNGSWKLLLVFSDTSCSLTCGRGTSRHSSSCRTSVKRRADLVISGHGRTRIDKATSSILNRSLTSMYKWYADSAATLVFLADVAHPSRAGDLAHSLWMTRAWTLQELLAPKAIFFYDSEWKPYLGNTGDNHKESLEIMQELADATKIPYGTITTFSPDDLAIREKLRLASTRNATVEEDVAYSLIGIFKSDIRPHYGEGTDALGHLLEEIVARFGDVSVLAWSGKSSSYNSCLPASISVYNQLPYHPPSLEGEEMETYITKLRGKLSQEVAMDIYNQINSLPPARFAARRLHLPCIIFPVRRLGIQEGGSSNEIVYCARVSGLGNVQFTTADDLILDKQKKFVFAHPWIGHIRGPSSGLTGEDDWESDTDTDTDSEGHPGWDGVTLSNFVAATPRVGGYVRALQMIARFGQPFSAFLLVQQPSGEYKRVAAENEIVVPGLGTAITAKNVRTQILEIL